MTALEKAHAQFAPCSQSLCSLGKRDLADVAELVDALDLGSSAERRGGSSPLIRTKLKTL